MGKWWSENREGKTVTSFDFSAEANGPIPSSDALGQNFVFYVPANTFATGAVIDGGYARTTESGQTVDKGWYLDTKKHDYDISEAGATVKFDAHSTTFALCLWADYISKMYPTGVLVGAAHIRMTTTSVSYDIWGTDGIMATIGTAPISLALATDHTIMAKFVGSTAEIYVNGNSVLTVTDPRIATVGRKVACFEPYQNANVVGFVRIKSGFSSSSMIEEDGNLLYPIGKRKQQANGSLITVAQSFVDLVASQAVPYDTAIAICKFPLAQTVAGDVYINFAATAPDTITTDNIVTANRDVRTNVVTVMGYVTGLKKGTVKVRIARSAGAAATVPISTYLDHPEVVYIPVS